MTAKWCHAPEVQSIAEVLIAEHHQHLIGHRVEYLFRNQAPKSHGRFVLGRARLVRGMQAFLARSNQLVIRADDGELLAAGLEFDDPVDPVPFFVIEISLDLWGKDVDGERQGLTDAQRVALVDHELCHCDVDDDGVPRMAGHNVEEFAAVVKRHGLWKPDVAWFAKQIRGARELPFDGWNEGSA